VSLITGTPVHATARLVVDGILSGVAANSQIILGIAGTGEGHSALVNFDTVLIAAADPFPFVQEYEFDLSVGEQLAVKLTTIAAAVAVRESPSSVADLGSTAHFYLDFGTDGVTYDALSGHDYRTEASVPEPATLALAGVGLCGLSILRRRRRTWV
jgi:hypothetical protein